MRLVIYHIILGTEGKDMETKSRKISFVNDWWYDWYYMLWWNSEKKLIFRNQKFAGNENNFWKGSRFDELNGN